MAWAPKLMRREKGVVGTVRADIGSSSSTAFSSMESELLVEMLPLRRLNGVVAFGEVPVLLDSPRVDMERRRRWSLIAVGKGVAAAVDPFLWKRLVSGLLTELRRGRDMSAEGGFVELSLDMLRDVDQDLARYMDDLVMQSGCKREKRSRGGWYVLAKDGSSLCRMV